MSLLSPASLLSICYVHTKKGLKSLLIPEHACETLQRISYSRNLELGDFGEAQEASTMSCKFRVEMLAAVLKTIGSQLKPNCIKNIY